MPEVHEEDEVETMTARQYLGQVKQIKGSIEVLSQEVSALETIATKTVGVMSPDRIQTSKTGKEGEDTVLNIVELKTEISETLNRLFAVRQEIAYNIAVYAPRDAVVLYDYYIKGKTLEEIEKERGRKKPWAMRRKEAGEKAIQTAMLNHPKEFSQVNFPN